MFELVLFFLKAENNFCHLDIGVVDVVVVEDDDGEAADAVDDDDDDDGLDAFDVVVGGVENVTLCVDGEVGGCSRCCCSCCCGGRW